MDRVTLAKIDPSKVRKDGKLFAEFKRYVTEDAPLIYASGKLPQGCFGCNFKTIFGKWKNVVLNQGDDAPIKAQPKNKKNMDKKTYKLDNPVKKYYFKGKVLSKKSSDGDWIDWIKYPKEKSKVEARKKIFSVLPEALQPKKKAEVDGAKG